MDTHARKGLRWTRLLLALAVLFAVSAPIAVFAAGGHFTDDDSSAFESHINWMADAGITLGCNPPANDLYCPNDNVTRGQMAAFMHRFAQYLDAEDGTPAEADHATSADNADTVGGYAPDSLVRAAGTNIATIATVTANSTTPFGSVSITAPVDGVLLVNGSLNLWCSGFLTGCSESNGNTYVNVDGTQYARSYYSIDGGDSSVNGADWNSSNSAYVPVTAGDHTVAIDVANSSGSAGPTYVWSGGINVLFVPFGGDGSTPAGVATPALSAAEAGQN